MIDGAVEATDCVAAESLGLSGEGAEVGVDVAIGEAGRRLHRGGAVIGGRIWGDWGKRQLRGVIWREIHVRPVGVLRESLGMRGRATAHERREDDC